MKNYSLIALALLLGTLLATCVGCAPAAEHMKPTHTVTLFDGHGQVLREYRTSWYSMVGDYVNLVDSDTGQMIRVRSVAMIVEPIKGTEDQ